MSRVAGRYDILARVALGASAEVARARDRDTGAIVWLKRLSPVHDDIEQAAERLEREASLGARLSAPETVAVLDAGRDASGRPWLVTPWIAGVTLARLRTAPSLSGVVVARVLADAARGLHHIHTRCGVVHGDVCPDNVLVGGDGRARIVDLGAAVPLGADAALSGRHGRQRYLAPERLTPGTRLDARADVYALGRVLRETGDDDDALQAIAARASAADRARRQPDAAALADELEGWLQGRGEVRAAVAEAVSEASG